jgi:hypothetical protein
MHPRARLPEDMECRVTDAADRSSGSQVDIHDGCPRLAACGGAFRSLRMIRLR